MNPKDTKIPMPRKFVDYWLENALTWEVDVSVPCDYCNLPIDKGQSYFTVFVGNHVEPGIGEEPGTVVQNPKKRGHLHHLKYAEPVPWNPLQRSRAARQAR